MHNFYIFSPVTLSPYIFFAVVLESRENISFQGRKALPPKLFDY